MSSLITETAVAATPDLPVLDVIGRDLCVPVVTGGMRRFVHLDYAASAPALQIVADAVDEFLPWYSSVHRGAGYTSTVSSEALEVAREVVRAFVGGRPDDAVIFTRHTTDSLNLLAHALPDDTAVLTLDIEHHANLLPWRNGHVVHLRSPASTSELAATFDDALARVTTAHAVVAITGASNVTGEVLPIADVAAVARRHGARLVVDAAQLAPHRRIDVAELGIDYIAFSGHKLYAPYGIGVLVGRRDWLDDARPHLAGGGSVRRVTTTDVDWAASPSRHEAGTPNVIGAVALTAACRALASLGMDRIEAHDAALLGHVIAGLERVEGVRVLSAFEGPTDRVGIAALHVREPNASIVAAALSAEHAIATRDGAFCAHPLLRHLLGAGNDGELPNALRVSVGVGTTRADIDAFIRATAEIVSQGPQWNYALSNGRLGPVPDNRPRPSFLESIR